MRNVLERLQDTVPVVRMNRVGPTPRVVVETLEGLLPHVFVGRADVEHAARFPFRQPKHLTDVLRQLTKPLLTFAKGRLHLLALRDVTPCRKAVKEFSVLIAHRRCIQADI